MIRLFVALPLPDEVRERLSRLAAGLPGAKWIKSENYHVTLRFIGEVPEDTAHDVDAALDTVTTQPFPVTLDGLGTFGRGHMAKTLWVGVRPSDPLRHLRDKVESALVRAGLPPEERKFTPHVTLARLGDTPEAKLAAYLGANGMFLAGPIQAERFVLFESVLGKGGSAYHELRSYPLGGWRPD